MPILAARLLTPALAGTLLLVAPVGVAAQWLEDPLLGRFGVRVGALPSVVNWSERFGTGGAVPLGSDLTDPALGTRLLPHLLPLEEALGAGPGTLRLGRLRAVRGTTVVTVPVSVELGITSFLTIGATVPFVRRRVESDLAFSPEGATVGFNPALEDPDGVGQFLSAFAGALDGAAGAVAALCSEDPGSADCVQGEGRISEAETLLRLLTLLYGAPLVPLEDAEAGMTLAGRFGALAEAFALLGVPMDLQLPLADSPLDEEGLDLFLTSAGLGVGLEGVSTVQRPWELGDTDVYASVGLLERVQTDTAGAFTGRVQVVAGGSVRLPTGAAPGEASPLDPGTGGGTRDLGVSIVADVARPRWGVRAGARYTVRGQVEEERRIASPDALLAGVALRRTVIREAGNVAELEVSPRMALAPNFGIGVSWRMLRRQADAFRSAPGSDPGGGDLDPTVPDPAILAEGSGGSIQFAALTFSYTTANLAREGGYGGRPFDILVRAERALAGSGGIRAPKDMRLQGGLRFYIGSP
jgi:hypothetical protein